MSYFELNTRAMILMLPIYPSNSSLQKVTAMILLERSTP